MKILAAVLSATLLASVSTAALAGETSCGCYEPPKVHKAKTNAGVGNGSEVIVLDNDNTESGDIDPGNSQDNNNAGSNVGKPRSPRAGDVNFIP